MQTGTPIPYQFALAEAEGPEDFLSECNAREVASDARPYWKRSAYSLNCDDHPFVLCCLEGARGSLTSQIAAQMSASSALAGVLSSLEAAPTEDDVPRATAIVRRGIKSANADVYSYAHKMGAGGKVGATGFLSCFAGSRCSIARVGSYGVYACREGRVLELFEAGPARSESGQDGVLQRFIGANAQVLVDLISLELASEDAILFTSQPAEALPFDEIASILSSRQSLQEQVKQVQAIQRSQALSPDKEGNTRIARNSFTGLLRVGAPVITLTEVLK